VGFLIILIVGFALMWLLIILPQRRRQAAHERLISELELGDEVITAGGMYGNVTTIGVDEVNLEVAPGVNVRISKRAVAAVVPPEEDEEEEEEEYEREQAELERPTEPVDQDRS
jgi:preprotein translocase subunit YajC